jgi:hypothetical protein
MLRAFCAAGYAAAKTRRMSSTIIDYIVYCRSCGMEFSTNEVMRGLLAASLETAKFTCDGFRNVGHGPGSKASEYIKWLIIRHQKQAVIDDVERIRSHPLVPPPIPIYGFVYDVGSGKTDCSGRRQRNRESCIITA